MRINHTNWKTHLGILSKIIRRWDATVNDDVKKLIVGSAKLARMLRTEYLSGNHTIIRDMARTAYSKLYEEAGRLQTGTPISPNKIIWRNLLSLVQNQNGGIEVSIPEKGPFPDLFTFYYTTEPRVIRGIPLGRFLLKCKLKIGKRQEIETLRAIAMEPNESKNGYTHPHIQDEHICLGDYGAQINSLFKSGSLMSAFGMIEDLLNNYGSAPFTSIDNWSRTTCFCGSETESTCDYCEELTCEHHLTDTCNGQSVCPECLFVCGSCGKNWTPDHQKTCSVCGDHYCSECIKGEVCKSCGIECPNCHTSVTKNEVYKCACGIEVCSQCYHINLTTGQFCCEKCGGDQ